MRARLPVLVLLCMAQFVDVLDVNASIVALPLIARDFRLDDGALQWVVTAYVLVFAGCLLVAGRLADTYGRRRIFAAGMLVFTVASMVCGLAPSAPALVAARAFQGLGAALTAPAALALIVDAFNGDRRAVAAWTAVAAVGGAAGLVLGGVIADALGWRWVFLINVPIGAVTLALIPVLLRESRAEARRVDLLSATAATGGLALLVAALSGMPAALAGAAALLALFVRRDRASSEPLVIRDRTVAKAAIAGALLTATTSGTGVLASLYLQGDAGLGPSAASLALLPLSVAVVVGSIVGARLEIGVVLVAAGCAALALGGVASVLVWGALAGYGLGAASVAATTLGTSAVAEADRGAVSGLLNTAAQVGTAVGVAALVAIGDPVLAAVAALAGAVALRPRRAVAAA
ncbi:MAG TPA: MFS transporter [Solirubrobacter sp.]|nr:MFS transporter [Solirubrobacter sp.]